MAFDPDLLILDEPTSGLDPVARREFVEGVLADFQDEGKTIFVSSHLVNELAGLIDQVGILHEGRLLLNSTSEGFMDSVRRVRLAFDGPAPGKVTCQGALKYTANGREALLSVRDFDEARLRSELTEALSETPPTGFEVERLNLEDAFVEFIGAAERGAL